MNVHVERAVVATAIAAGLAGAVWFGTAIGSACPTVAHGVAAADGGVPGPAVQYAYDYSGQLSAYVGLPVCAYEDGNTDGAPCIWTSPGSGLAYWVDSSGYVR